MTLPLRSLPLAAPAYASGVRAYGAHLYLPPRASKVTPRGPLRLRSERRMSCLLRDPAAPRLRRTGGARPRSSLRSEVAFLLRQGYGGQDGSKEAACLPAGRACGFPRLGFPPAPPSPRRPLLQETPDAFGFSP